MDNKSSGGVGFLGILTIVFIVLKLVGVIEWSWVIVLLPLIIPSCLFFLVVTIKFISLELKEKR